MFRGAGAAFAFVHCLHATGLDVVTLCDELGGERLRSRHQLGPRVAAVELFDCVVQREVGGHDVIESCPTATETRRERRVELSGCTRR